MEGKFKMNYSTKEEFEFGVKHWLGLMEEWKEADTEFKRDFKVTTDDENLTIVVKVTSERDLNI